MASLQGGEQAQPSSTEAGMPPLSWHRHDERPHPSLAELDRHVEELMRLGMESESSSSRTRRHRVRNRGATSGLPHAQRAQPVLSNPVPSGTSHRVRNRSVSSDSPHTHMTWPIPLPPDASRRNRLSGTTLAPPHTQRGWMLLSDPLPSDASYMPDPIPGSSSSGTAASDVGWLSARNPDATNTEDTTAGDVIVIDGDEVSTNTCM